MTQLSSQLTTNYNFPLDLQKQIKLRLTLHRHVILYFITIPSCPLFAIHLTQNSKIIMSTATKLLSLTHSKRSRNKRHNQHKAWFYITEIQTERPTLPSHPMCLCHKSGGLFTSKAVVSFVEDSSCSQNNNHCQRQDAHSYPQSHPRVRVQVAAGCECWQHNHRSGTFITSQLTQTGAIKTRPERAEWWICRQLLTTYWRNKTEFTQKIHIFNIITILLNILIYD